MEFKQYRQLQRNHVDWMLKGQGALFTMGVEKDRLWELYLDSFPPGTNEIFRERREFDCACCRQFVRAFGVIRTGLKEQLEQDDTDDLFGEVSKEDAVTRLKLEIVEHIIRTKVAEEAAAKDQAKLKAKKQKLLALRVEKQDEALKELDVDELDKMIAELED